MAVHLNRISALPLILLAGGCAAQAGSYPSLAIRESELAWQTMAVPEVPPAPQPAPATLEQLGSLSAQARAAHSAFISATEATRARVRAANGVASGSEAWSIAQVALADLRSHRSIAVVALANLDRIYNDAASTGVSTDEIGQVRGEVVMLVADEDRVLDTLIKQLAP